MNREDIITRMSAITETGDVLSDEAVAEYETLERSLAAINKSDEIMKRQAAYTSVQAPAVVFNRHAEDEMAGFTHYLRTGVPNGDLVRAQSEGAGSGGGYLVPEGFRATLIDRLKAFGGVQSGADSITTSSGNTLPWPNLDDTSNVGAVNAESANLPSGADLTFGTRMLGAYTYDSNGAGNAALKVPFELLQDSAFDIAGLVSRKLAERIYRKLATDFVNGTGAGEMTGLLSTAGGLTAMSAWSSNTAPTYADFVNMVHAIDPAYRQGAVWVFNDAVVQLVRKIVDTTGRPLLWDTSSNLTQDLRGGMQLLGFPVIVDQACPSPASGNKFGFFGDLKQAFIIRTVADISVMVLNEKYAENRQRGFMAWGRWDSNVQNTWAGQLMTAV